MSTAITSRALTLALIAAAAFTLAACDQRGTSNDKTPGQALDSALQKTEEATKAAAGKAAELAEKARDNTKAYIDSPEVKKDAAAIKDTIRNAGNAALSSADDAAITASVKAGIARDPDLKARDINVSTQAGAVSLSGPAPSAEAKARAESIAKSVNGVGSVDNRLAVSAN